MRVSLLAVVLPLVSAALACGSLKEGDDTPPAATGHAASGDAGTSDPAQPPVTPPAPPADVEKRVDVVRVVEGRSRLGGRSLAAMRPWRGGLVATPSRIYWIECGARPGLYATATAACTTGDCVEKIATLVRPSLLSATSTHLYVVDVRDLYRVPLAGGALDKIATAAEEISGIAPVEDAVFWTSDSGAIRRTVVGGTTSTPIHSNGTPVAMARTSGHVYWMGSDISGLQGLLQRIQHDGTGPRALSNVGGPFFAMGGDATFLYYARGNLAEVRRLTVATGREDVVARDLLPVSDFALDGEHVYWTERGASPDFLGGGVRRARHDGTSVEILAESIPGAVAIAVTGGTVYVASAGTAAEDFANGAILKLTLSPSP